MIAKNKSTKIEESELKSIFNTKENKKKRNASTALIFQL